MALTGKPKICLAWMPANRIEYVVDLEPKFSDPSFLFFLRKFNTIYNMMHRTDDVKDPIEVYFDNQIGIIEVETNETKEKKKKKLKVATGGEEGDPYQFDILKIIEARNEKEEIIGTLIEDFEGKIQGLFDFVRAQEDGKRLIVKIKSHVSEDEIFNDFAKLYRRYKALNRKKVGDYFFKETEDLVDKLCADFETTISNT